MLGGAGVGVLVTVGVRVEVAVGVMVGVSVGVAEAAGFGVTVGDYGGSSANAGMARPQLTSRQANRLIKMMSRHRISNINPPSIAE